MGNLANFSKVLSSEPGTCETHLRLLGTGAAAPTKVFGNGVVVTRVAAGVYEVAWGENPGMYLGFVPGFEATVAADLKGYSVVAGVFNTVTFKQRFSVFDSTFAAADLAALQWLNLVVKFKSTAVS